MTNPFTGFAFQATGEPTNRTLPDRLADIKNVKDFGAVGDWNGSSGADNLSAIMAALNRGQVTLVATANGSGNTMTFAGGVPASVMAGMYPIDVTTPSAFNPDAPPTVSSTTATTVTIGGSAAGVLAGDTITFNLQARGIVFFPPGNYYVSAPIDFSDFLLTVCFVGVAGATVTGNFADYVFKRGANSSNGNGGIHTVEGLTVVNTNAAGGGIRLGYCVGASIRDCNVTANQGINTASSDLRSDGTTQEGVIENCTVNPGSNPTNSVGIMSVSDGPILNCVITGYAVGMRLWGQQGGATIEGCRFELCNLGFDPGVLPAGGGGAYSGWALLGCYFLNCGRALALDRANAGWCAGVRIESTNATVFGSTPASGISGAGALNSFFDGVYITGQFSNAGVDISAAATLGKAFSFYSGIAVNNTGAGVNWKLSSSPLVAKFKACSVGPAYAVATLPIQYLTVTSAIWLHAAIATLNVASLVSGSGYTDGAYNGVAVQGGSGTSAFFNQIVVQGGAVVVASLNPYQGSGFVVGDTLTANTSAIGGTGSGFSIKVATVQDVAILTLTGSTMGSLSNITSWNIVVSGVTPSGFNGTFNSVGAISGNQFAYPLSNPGGSGSSGSVVAAGVNNLLEGDTYNINDGTNGLAWSNTITNTGPHASHYNVRYSGNLPTNFTVVGK